MVDPGFVVSEARIMERNSKETNIRNIKLDLRINIDIESIRTIHNIDTK